MINEDLDTILKIEHDDEEEIEFSKSTRPYSVDEYCYTNY